ncbi:hypothetical protein ACLBP3_29545, partial [Klebsiella pneumoniae]|uniref:hypothetical protein n=1 Tax=Klebsiella pneumoniae TaxID=573 RepID=UPI00396BB43E
YVSPLAPSGTTSLDDVHPIGLITSSNEPPKLLSLNDYIDEFNWHSSADNDYNNVSLELMLNTHHTTLWECDNILVKDVTIKQALKEGVDKQLINTD